MRVRNWSRFCRWTPRTDNYFWRAKLFAAQGTNQQAIADFNTAVELDPNYADAYTELAHLYMQRASQREAARMLAKRKRMVASTRTSEENRQLLSAPDTGQ
jgi:Flp pilus assembly protein TadD